MSMSSNHTNRDDYFSCEFPLAIKEQIINT